MAGSMFLHKWHTALVATGYLAQSNASQHWAKHCPQVARLEMLSHQLVTITIVKGNNDTQLICHVDFDQHE